MSSGTKKTLWGRVKSINTRSVLLYLFFVFISAIFWCFVTLNKTIQQDVTIKLVITDIPAKVTFIEDAPSTINVSIRERGAALLSYMLGANPTLKVKFADYSDSQTGTFAMSATQLRNLVKSIVGREATVSSVQPDNIKLKYTTLSKKVPIRLDADIKPNISYVLMGVPVLSQDSVTVYGDSETLAEINEAYTYHVQESGNKDTLRRDVAIAPIVGVKIVPRTVRMMVPIEQLILKHAKVPVTLRNNPPEVNMVLFPSTIDANFLVPKSQYKNKSSNITAIVDYNSINFNSGSNKAAVRVGEAPAVYRNVELSTDSVEYIIER